MPTLLRAIGYLWVSFFKEGCSHGSRNHFETSASKCCLTAPHTGSYNLTLKRQWHPVRLWEEIPSTTTLGRYTEDRCLSLGGVTLWGPSGSYTGRRWGTAELPLTDYTVRVLTPNSCMPEFYTAVFFWGGVVCLFWFWGNPRQHFGQISCSPTPLSEGSI